MSKKQSAPKGSEINYTALFGTGIPIVLAAFGIAASDIELAVKLIAGAYLLGVANSAALVYLLLENFRGPK